MLQFNSQEIERIRINASDELIEKIIQDNKVVINSDTLVPPDGRATWNLYYFCPKHAVRLAWDRNSPEQHKCPVDGEILTGEPYDGAWWRFLNGLNAKACNDLGLLWQITKEPTYKNKVKEILLGYAEFYPDYEVHGGIPYNGPGKANAQTLCEANCNIDFARGYDFIKDELTNDECQFIEERLLREGAEFLMEHRSDQLHNHEMKISATIGVIGLILNEPRYVDFAVNTPYGLRYQLQNGVKGEGLWFEGSIHYHYYALQALLNFEKIACKTEYSLKQEPNFYTMLAFPLKLLINTGDFPRLNDCIAGQEKLTHSHLFEFGYREFNDPLFASALSRIYQTTPRNNIDSLLFGVDDIPESKPLQCAAIHTPQSGITIMTNNNVSNMLLLKHSPYGGEHDHYDRLGLIISRQGKEILPDLGTTGYGAELHYGYYKNSVTHNTLAVEQQNQPPANPRVNSFIEQEKQLTWLDVEVDWCGELPQVDSHTIVQWDEDAYKNIVFRRQVLWLGDAVIELNKIENPREKQLDLIWHVRGKHQLLSADKLIDNPFDGPLSRMTRCHEKTIVENTSIQYSIAEQQDFTQQIMPSGESQLIRGYAPDNPATCDLAYTLLRSREKMLQVNVLHDLSIDQNIVLVDISQSESLIEVKLLRASKIEIVIVDIESKSISVN
jgi:hypothetical protein